MSRLGRFLLEYCDNSFRINLSEFAAEINLLRYKPLDIQMHAIRLGIIAKW